MWEKALFEVTLFLKKEQTSHSNILHQGCFFFHVLFGNFDDQLSLGSHRIYFVHNVGIHQVRILVFDKACSMPLIIIWLFINAVPSILFIWFLFLSLFLTFNKLTIINQCVYCSKSATNKSKSHLGPIS